MTTTMRLTSVLFAVIFMFTALTTAAPRTIAAELVMFEQDYCEWCERWNKEIGVVYAKTEEGRKAPLRRVDIHDRRPADLKKIKGIVYTPTFVLLDEGGEEIGRILGYPGEDFFWSMLDELLQKLKRGKKSS